MEKDSFQITEIFPVKPSVIYHAWLNSVEHSEMIGAEAECTNYEGGKFTAWDGYITGKNIKLIENKEIVQNWRTSEFKSSDEDSELIIRLRETKEGCELTLIQNNIPKGQPDYKKGWVDNYFIPMKNYFKV
ncbi:MAG: SRPBCC domain-containing protein [Bacteroidales bacterium]